MSDDVNVELQLYAWACGDFDYVETHTQRKYNGKQLPVRVYTTKGLAGQGKFALGNAARTVDYFSEVSYECLMEVVILTSTDL